MKYGQIMKEIRTYDLNTQKDIATKLGINKNTYAQYELQNKIIPISHLNEFCSLFNISMDYVLGLTTKRKYKNMKTTISSVIVGKRLKEFRKENSLTQKDLADFLKTSQSNIVEYEQGKHIISTSYLYALCIKYNVSADYLLGRIDSPKSL